MGNSKKLASAAARRLSRRGASKGGVARAAALTPAQRSAVARRAAMTRWKGPDRIAIAFDGARGFGPDHLAVGASITHPEHGQWSGEAILTHESLTSSKTRWIGSSPRFPDWVDIGAFRLLAEEYSGAYLQRGERGAAHYLREDPESPGWKREEDTEDRTS